jgi:hypothetical protein
MFVTVEVADAAHFIPNTEDIVCEHAIVKPATRTITDPDITHTITRNETTQEGYNVVASHYSYIKLTFFFIYFPHPSPH